MLLFLTSCEDSLERYPNDSLIADTAYQSVSDLQMGLNGVLGSYSNASIVQFATLFTDESKIGVDNGGQGAVLYGHRLDSNTGESSAIWTGRYRVINLANRIIAAAEKITPSASEKADYDNILGQCYAIRALCHLDLLNHFTADPTNLGSLAVPYITVVFPDNAARNTVEEVRDAIFADLDTAESLINTSDLYYATQKFIDFSRTKTHFLTGAYNTALTLADNVISNTALADASQYPAVFSDANSSVEVIFKRRMASGVDAPFGGIWYFTGTGGAHMEMSNKLYNVLASGSPNDVRSGVLFDVINSDPSNNLHLVNKYPGSSGVLYMNDQKIMRVSEMYLIKAECQARLSQFGQAAQTLKQLRDSRLFGSAQSELDTYTNLFDAATAILNERFVELAYEGHRYVDIKRLRSAVGQGIERDPADCGDGACSIGITDNRFVLPIPYIEIQNNSGIGQENQNPGY